MKKRNSEKSDENARKVDDRTESENISEPDTEKSVFLALGHEFRREIIKLIGGKGSAGFSEIKALLKVSTGTVYHHLDVLQALIQQNEQKKYIFTELGQYAYNLIKSSSESVNKWNENSSSFLDRPLKPWQAWLLGHPLFKYYFSHFKASMGISALILLIIAGLSMLIRVQAFINIFLPIFEPLDSVFGRYPIIQFFSVFLGYLILVGLVEGIARGLFKKKENFRWVVSILSTSYIPLVFYLICLGFLKLIDLNPVLFLILSRILLIFFQAWGTIILAIGISLVKSIKFERSLMIVLFIDYATLMVLLLFNTPFL